MDFTEREVGESCSETQCAETDQVSVPVFMLGHREGQLSGLLQSPECSKLAAATNKARITVHLKRNLRLNRPMDIVGGIARARVAEWPICCSHVANAGN